MPVRGTWRVIVVIRVNLGSAVSDSLFPSCCVKVFQMLISGQALTNMQNFGGCFHNSLRFDMATALSDLQADLCLCCIRLSVH